MKKVLFAMGIGLLAWKCYALSGINLVPPTSTNAIIQDGSGDMNFVDASTGPLTLSSLANHSNLVGPSVISSSATIRGSLALTGLTIAQINTLTPATTGQVVFCTDCVSSNLCISTGTAVQSFSAVSSTSTISKTICK